MFSFNLRTPFVQFYAPPEEPKHEHPGLDTAVAVVKHGTVAAGAAMLTALLGSAFLSTAVGNVSSSEFTVHNVPCTRLFVWVYGEPCYAGVFSDDDIVTHGNQLHPSQFLVQYDGYTELLVAFAGAGQEVKALCALWLAMQRWADADLSQISFDGFLAHMDVAVTRHAPSSNSRDASVHSVCHLIMPDALAAVVFRNATNRRPPLRSGAGWGQPMGFGSHPVGLCSTGMRKHVPRLQRDSGRQSAHLPTPGQFSSMHTQTSAQRRLPRLRVPDVLSRTSLSFPAEIISEAPVMLNMQPMNQLGLVLSIPRSAVHKFLADVLEHRACPSDIVSSDRRGYAPPAHKTHLFSRSMMYILRDVYARLEACGNDLTYDDSNATHMELVLDVNAYRARNSSDADERFFLWRSMSYNETPLHFPPQMLIMYPCLALVEHVIATSVTPYSVIGVRLSGGFYTHSPDQQVQ